MTVNPYHQWLDLDPKLKNPHYFQLLGVSAKVTNAANYRKQINAAADAKLKLLEQKIGTGDRPEIVDQLRQRIQRARAILQDEKLRTQYVAKLKSGMGASQHSDAGLLSSDKKTVTDKKANQSKKTTAEVSKPETLIPHPDTQLAAELPPTFNPSMSDIMPAAILPVVTTTDAVPMAVPLDRSESDFTHSTKASDVHESTSVGNDEVNISLPARRRSGPRRKSRMLLLFHAVVLLLMTGLSVAGIYFIIERLVAPKILDQPSVSKNEDGFAMEAEGGSLSATNIAVDQKPLDNVNHADEPSHLLAESTPTKNSGGNLTAAEPNPLDKNENLESSIDADLAFVHLSAFDQFQIVNRLQRIRRSLVRHDLETAGQQIEQTQRQFDKFLDGKPNHLAPSQQRLLTHLQAIEQAAKRLQGFWDQVVRSSRSIPGGQEIRLAGQKLGFVEATDQFVLLKNAGSIIKYEFQYMRPNMAVALAEQGAIPDIPTWRMQLATFLGLHQNQQDMDSGHLEELIGQSVADGHDDTLLREFLNDDFSDLVEFAKIEAPDDRSLTEQLADIPAIEFGNDTKNPSPTVAVKRAQQAIEIWPANPAQAIALLRESHQLAIRGGDAYLVEDAILELSELTPLALSATLVDSFHELCQQKLDAIQARKLMETAIPRIKSELTSPADRRKTEVLVQRLTKLAEENDFVDSLLRLSQRKPFSQN